MRYYDKDYDTLFNIRFLEQFETTNFGCNSLYYYLHVKGFYTTTWKRGVAGKAFAKFVEKKLDEAN